MYREKRDNLQTPAMLRRLLFAGYAALLLLLLLPTTCDAKPKHRHCHSSCGNILDIRYPFRFKDDRPRCGNSKYELICENNRAILHLYSGRYYVEEINYDEGTLRIVDTGLQRGNCSSLPLHSLTRANFSFRDPYRLSYWTSYVNFIDCEAPINSSGYIDMAPCRRKSNSANSSVQTYSYVVVQDMSLSDLEDSCSVAMVVGVYDEGIKKIDNCLSDIHDRLLFRTVLRWCDCYDYFCTPCGEMSQF